MLKPLAPKIAKFVQPQLLAQHVKSHIILISIQHVSPAKMDAKIVLRPQQAQP